MKTIEKVIQEYEFVSRAFVSSDEIQSMISIENTDEILNLCKNSGAYYNENHLDFSLAVAYLKHKFLQNGISINVLICESDSDNRPNQFVVIPELIKADKILLNLDEKQTQILKDSLSETE